MQKIRLNIENASLEGLFVTSQQNISYLLGIKCRDSFLLISRNTCIFFTDSRYIEESKLALKAAQKSGISVEDHKSSIFQAINKACRRLRIKNLGFEENALSFSAYKKLQSQIDNSIKLVPTNSLVECLRLIKEPCEIDTIRRATSITIEAFKFIKEYIAEGRKEIEIAAELERFIRYHGANASAFDIIVAAGRNSSFPHHITSQKRLILGEPVTIDMGADYLGYKSDLTRVFFLGKISALVQKVYATVLGAQEVAIKKVKPGIAVSEVDAACRNFISKKGYGAYFTHSTGHGVGLDIHEAPRISKKDNTIIKPGMVFTIEPAIYLPGKFGIRIEDLVLVTKKGCEVISGILNK